MRRPRFRLTIGRMMIAVLAGGLGWAIARPYPVFSFSSATWYITRSDGGSSTCDGPKMMAYRGNSWLLIVDWPDGRTGYYLTVR